jgi:hypothetical protein
MTVPSAAFAQPLWVDRSADRALSLEFLKPNYEGETDETFFSATWFLSARVAANDIVTVVGQAPFNRIAVEDQDGSSTLGNIYFGAEFHNRNARVFAELGVYVPIADDQEMATAFGALGNFVDRAEAFVTEAMPIALGINYYHRDSSGFVSRVRVAPTFWVATGEREESDVFLLYSGQVGYSSDVLCILAGVSGRWFVTSEDADISEATFHQMGLMVGGVWGIARPAVHLRAPLDEDLSNLVDLVWGLSVTVDVGG